jgi:TolB-like protein/class 3 adenylate cyclase/Flp pilus assembly protein TadD
MSEKSPQSSSERRLVAIMFTDVVGYTALMQEDEGAAVDTIERHRFILEKCTLEFHGNILQYYGDGSLSIFPSALEAVECALKIQKELTRVPIVPLRIGIHLGDIKIQEESVLGDGVNMASRVQSMGVAGSILITDTIYYLVRNHSAIKTVPLGIFTLKNIDYPVPIYALTEDFLSIPKSDELSGGIKNFPNKHPWITLITSIMILIVVGFALNKYISRNAETSVLEDKSIAVLPFDNLSNDPQQEYFSDGITDDIINHLVKISALKVKSRTTTAQYKNPDKTVPVIGRELGVSYILEGSVRKAENKVRIVAQLIDVANDVHVWTETFDREITEIFEIQSEIAIEIARILEARLTTEERKYIKGVPAGIVRSKDITAYDYELRARDIWRNWNNEKDLENAMQLIEKAIELDSSYARGYVLKGNILHYGMRNLGVSTQIWIDKALQMADLAISLDSTLAEAYLLRGNIYRNQDGKAEQSRMDLRRAYELEPGNPDVMQSLARHLLRRGEFEMSASLTIQAIEREYSVKDSEYYLRWGDIYFRMVDEFGKAEKLYKKAISLAPDWTVPYQSISQLYRYWDKLDKAEETLSEALDISPMDQGIIDLLGWTNLLNGDLQSASRYWSMYVDLEHRFTDSSQYIPFRHRLGYVKYLQGDTVTSIKLMKEQRQRDLERYQDLRGYGAWSSRGFYYDLACTNSFLGNIEEALIWLDRSYHTGFVNIWYLENDPLLANIRETLEFRKIQNELKERRQKQIRAFKKVIKENKSLLGV